MKGILVELKVKNKSFNEDVKELDFPFDLLSGFESIIKEAFDKKFKYKSVNTEGQTFFSFTRSKEVLMINVSDENLTIRHFDIIDKKRKLRVLYVIKPSERDFKLL